MKTTKYGMITTIYGNPNSQHGLIFIIGTKFQNAGDNATFLKIEKALRENNALKIMVIDYEDKTFNREQLTEALVKFMEGNIQNTIINGIHGAQVAPFIEHYSIIGPETLNSYFSLFGEAFVNFANGKFVKSTIVLDAIGEALKYRPADVWQCSCQGTKLVSHAQKVFPVGSNYVVESAGFIYPSVFVNTVIDLLKSNQDFEFDALYKKYLAVFTKINNFQGIINPGKVTIGGELVLANQQSDALVKEIRDNTLFEAKFNLAAYAHCNALNDTILYEGSQTYEPWQYNFIECVSFVYNLKNSIITTPPTSTFTDCVDTHNERSYVEFHAIETAYRLFAGTEGYSALLNPENCLANYLNSGSYATFESLSEHYFS